MSYPKKLQDWQDEVHAWHIKVKGDGPATHEMVRKLLEKAAEFLAVPCAEEAADIIICVLNIAAREGWRMDHALRDKLQVLNSRVGEQVARDTDRPLVQFDTKTGETLDPGTDVYTVASDSHEFPEHLG